MGNANTPLYQTVTENGISGKVLNEMPELWELHAGDDERLSGQKAHDFLVDVFLCVSQEGKRENRVADTLMTTKNEIMEWQKVLDKGKGFTFVEFLAFIRVLRQRASSFTNPNPGTLGVGLNLTHFSNLYQSESTNRQKFEEDMLAICGFVPDPPFKVIHHTYDEIPPQVKKLFTDLGFKRTECEMYIDAVWNIINFLLPEFIPSKDFRIKQKVGPATPTVSEDDIQTANSKLTPLPPKLFKKLKFLDKGGFGSVFSAPIKVDGKKRRLAIKKVAHGERDARYNLMEISFLSRCNHPNLVNFVCAFIVDPKKSKLAEPEVWIVMEYLEGGTLGSAATKSISLSEPHIAYIARELFRGLEFLHSKNWVHRDIKSANVMLDLKGQVKLIDFGLCADLSCGPQMCMVGSSYWIPPEMMSHDPHGLPADIWSAGVCLLELFNHGPPFGNTSNGGLRCMLTACMRGLSNQIPTTISTQAQDFLKKCLIREQYDRYTATNLLRAPWLNQPDLGKGIDAVLVQIFLGNVINTNLMS